MPSLCSSPPGRVAGDGCKGQPRTLMGSQPFLLAAPPFCSALLCWSPRLGKLLA